MNCPTCHKPTPPDSAHSCSPVPLLTAEMAQDDLEYEGEDKYSSGVEHCIEAIASGRVACHDTQAGVFVPFMSETEAREKFEAGFSQHTSVLRKDNYGCYIEKSAVFQWNGYRMALRDLKVIR